MQISLRNYFAYAESLKIDVDLAALTLGAGNGTGDRARGFYSVLGGSVVGMFFVAMRVFVYIDGTVLEDTGGMQASHAANGPERTLTINNAGKLSIVNYTEFREPVATQFYSECQEDADFGLWIANVLSSKERKEICMHSWAS